MSSETRKILITGASGQIGTELAVALRAKHGKDNVVASDLRRCPALEEAGPFFALDVLDKKAIAAAVERAGADTIVHLAAILSAVGEKNPDLAWDVNINGMLNVLDVARDMKLRQVFVPSSIAAFGPGTPLERTPNDTVLRPTTMYGVTKVAGELVCNYYVQKHGLDVRGLRYPGIISAETPPGGGTTDFAVAIFYEAVKTGRYTCFVREDTRLPMMYMPDCIKATLDLMAAPRERLVHHSDFNVGAMSFSAGELAAEIAKHVPGFTCSYAPDFRQAIADSWPRSVDDSAARAEWGWKPEHDLASMTVDMIRRLRVRHAAGTL
jgi:nucleoside-diphosphate-sugar epimerase